MATASIRGVNIHYEVVGIDGPWLVLITGGRRAYREFVPLAMKIAAEGFRVLLHDRRNTGASQMVIEGEAGRGGDLDRRHRRPDRSPRHRPRAFVGGASSGARTSMLTYLAPPRSR